MIYSYPSSYRIALKLIVGRLVCGSGCQGSPLLYLLLGNVNQQFSSPSVEDASILLFGSWGKFILGLIHFLSPAVISSVVTRSRRMSCTFYVLWFATSLPITSNVHAASFWMNLSENLRDVYLNACLYNTAILGSTSDWVFLSVMNVLQNVLYVFRVLWVVAYAA